MMTTYSVICRWLNFHNLQCANLQTAYCCIISLIRDCVRLTRVWPHEVIAKMDVGNGVGHIHFTVSTAPVVASWCSLLCGVIPMNMKGEPKLSLQIELALFVWSDWKWAIVGPWCLILEFSIALTCLVLY